MRQQLLEKGRGRKGYEEGGRENEELSQNFASNIKKI